MHCKLVLQSMIDNGFLDPRSHNPVDYVTYTRRAAEAVEAALSRAADPQATAELVATMFDNGFCARDRHPDPSEWITFAVQACEELGKGE